MALFNKKNKKQEKNKSSDNKSKSVYKTPVLSISNNIVFTNKSVWAYYKLTDKPYDFLSTSAKVGLSHATTQSLASLVRREDQSVDCHLLIVNNPFDPTDWEAQMIRNYNKIENAQKKIEESLQYRLTQPRDIFDDYVEETTYDLYNGNYMKRVTFLGVKLFTRGSFNFDVNPLESGLANAKEIYKNSLLQLFAVPDERITKEEEERAIASEKEIYQTLHEGSLAARRPSVEELLLTMKRRYYPSMPVPYLEISHDERVGLSDIEIETGGEMYVRPRGIEMKQFIDGEIVSGFRTTLTVSSFPKQMIVPSNLLPFFSRPSVLPFTCSARFVLTPTEKMRKDESKKKLEAQDEIANLQSSGQAVNQSLRDTLTDLEIMDYELTERREPWITGSYRITIEGKNQEVVNQIINGMQQEFKRDDIVLSLTTGDQLQLFREEQIGGDIEIKDFQHVTNLALLAAAGINHGGDIGDPITVMSNTSK